MSARWTMSSRGWRSRWRALPHPVRWLGVALTGGALVVAGLVLMVLPGPGIPLLILGLVILASEFAWAEVILHRVKHYATAAASKVSTRISKKGNTT